MFELSPIGVVRTKFTERSQIPRQGGGPAAVEVFPAYQEALEGIERCSHLWIIAFLEGAARDVLRARPRKANAEAPRRGVFSMRSPVRPNPIALTCARILEIQGPILTVDRLDYLDRTPVLDIKPYSPGWDLIPSAWSAHRYDPSRYEPDELLDALFRDATNALGPGAETAVTDEMVRGLARLVIDTGVDIRAADTLFAIGTLDERVEVLLCAASASFGNGRLALRDLPANTVLVASSKDQVWTVEIDSEGSISVR